MKLKEVVEKILKEVPEARKDDSVLLTEFYKKVYGVDWDFRGKKMPESITRIRRLIQSGNPELRDGDVYEKRQELAEVYRETKAKILLKE